MPPAPGSQVSARKVESEQAPHHDSTLAARREGGAAAPASGPGPAPAHRPLLLLIIHQLTPGLKQNRFKIRILSACPKRIRSAIAVLTGDNCENVWKRVTSLRSI